MSPEVDFIYLYSMGRIFNDSPPDMVYDYHLQQAVCEKVHPLKSGAYGPIPYSPLIGISFRPFARLPFIAAYLLWICLSFGLYVSGVILLSRHFFPNGRLSQSLILCLSLSYYPFINWTLLSGHISTLGFIALAVATRELDRQRLGRAGLALSFCIYKPTLIVLLVPMLLVSRRWRVLGGFSVGALVLTLAATIIEGPAVWPGYFRLLFSYGRASATVAGHSFKQGWKYVDLASISSAASGTPLTKAVVAAVAASMLCILLWIWSECRRSTGPRFMLIWAATITWTLVLNIYADI
ncbi:MAG: glycosyltransferase family 87 protein [Bryobacteraceae bacterium]